MQSLTLLVSIRSSIGAIGGASPGVHSDLPIAPMLARRVWIDEKRRAGLCGLAVDFHRGAAGDLIMKARPPSHFFSNRLAISLVGERADRPMIDRWCDGLKLVSISGGNGRVFLRESRVRAWRGRGHETKKAYGHSVHTTFALCNLHELIRNLKTVQN